MMGTRFMPYPETRDSGIERIGRVPSHWGIRKTPWVFSIGSGTTPNSEEPSYYDGDVPWITTSELRETVVCTTAKQVSTKALDDYSSLRLHPKGSVAIAMYGATIGRLGILGVPATVNQACCVFSYPKGVRMKFWFYWLQMRRAYLVSLGYGGGQPNLSQELFRSIRVPFPPEPEQSAIADFLDRETAKIDALVEKKERLIELLQEKRTALITHAVTKGLPAAPARADKADGDAAQAGLDPNVPMKDSGIEWLGQIPAHWDVKRIKHLAHVRRGASPRPIDDPIYFDDDGVFAWVRISDLTASDRYLEGTTQRLSKLGQSKSVCLEPGELFLSIAATVGKPIITRIKCCIHDGFVYFEGLTANAEFLWYMLQCGEAYKGLGKLGTQLNLNTETVGGISVPVPDGREQEAIVSFLDRETAKLDALIAKVREAIERLKEYRTALISAAVTGKIDVREEAEPDHA